MKKKPWYIWLSFYAFIALAFNTMVRITFSESSSTHDKSSIKIGAHLCTIMFATLGPLAMLSILLYNTPIRDSWIPTTTVLVFVYMYFAGVYATYSHVCWRDKNIPHLLKKKDNNNEQPTGESPCPPDQKSEVRKQM